MNGHPRQGDVCWADAPEPMGRRPVLVLTRNAVIDRLTNVTVAPLTRTHRDIASEVPLTQADGISKPSVVSLDNIVTFSKSRLDTRITHLSQQRMVEVWKALHVAFDIPDLLD